MKSQKLKKSQVVLLDTLPLLGEQSYVDDDGNYWNVANLIEDAKDLPVFEIPLIHITIPDFRWKIKNYRDFIRHMQQVNNADLKYPIILNDCGKIMDGFHRLAKALSLRKETIKAVRFDNTPQCTFVRVESD